MVKTVPPHSESSSSTTGAPSSSSNSTDCIKRKPATFYFHSVTVPQLVRESLEGENNHLASSKIKNCKFELHVLYYHLKKNQTSN